MAPHSWVRAMSSPETFLAASGGMVWVEMVGIEAGLTRLQLIAANNYLNGPCSCLVCSAQHTPTMFVFLTALAGDVQEVMTASLCEECCATHYDNLTKVVLDQIAQDFGGDQYRELDPLLFVKEGGRA